MSKSQSIYDVSCEELVDCLGLDEPKEGQMEAEAKKALKAIKACEADVSRSELP